MATVDLENVTKRFGAAVAADCASLAVGTGELVALLGPSGCGKTTLPAADRRLRGARRRRRPGQAEISRRHAFVAIVPLDACLLGAADWGARPQWLCSRGSDVVVRRASVGQF